MSEDQNPKKIIKKKIKLKVAGAPEKAPHEKDEEKKPIKKKAAVAAPAPVAAPEKPKVEKDKPESVKDHLKRMNEKYGGTTGGSSGGGYQGSSSSGGTWTPRPSYPRSPGGPGAGPGGPGGRRTFVAKDKSFGPGGGRPRFGGGAGRTETTTGEKDAGRNKHRSSFVDRNKKSARDIKEKNKSKEEQIMLSKLEESILKKSRKGEYAIPEEIEIGEVVKISDMAKKMNLKASEIIQKLMALGVQATINDSIDSDTATIVAADFNCKIVIKSLKEEVIIKEDVDTEADLKPRFPVVTIMGHVDHGKTSLLDAIRNSTIAEHETGGITQHIGAYKVKTPKGEITFVDTPGHEAFTAMRARGANVTDIVILVVSAVEGVMPQTAEAISHAKAAKVPIIVAVNKMDLPNTNIERLKQQLAEQSVQAEDWGGDTIFVQVSALKKTGINELLDAILLQAEVMELKANPDKKGVGFIIESEMDIGRGAVATLVVKNGSIKVGDYFVVGTTMGKVRGMFDENGKKIVVALPSYPVVIMGFDEVPNAGDKFFVVESEEVAKDIAVKRQNLKKIEDGQNIKKLQMQNAMDAMSSPALKELKIIIKADVQGSVEAIKSSLLKLSFGDIKINVIHAGVGPVIESDVLLGASTKGADKNAEEIGVMILAFRVRVESIAKEKAESDGITVKRFSIIYEIIDYVDGIVKGMIKPEIKETIIGTAEIKEIYKIKDIGKIAGCTVNSGFIRKSEKVRLSRDGAQVWEGNIKELKRFKDDANEVQEGFDCGISFVNYENFKKGDVIECVTFEEIQKAQG